MVSFKNQHYVSARSVGIMLVEPRRTQRRAFEENDSVDAKPGKIIHQSLNASLKCFLAGEQSVVACKLWHKQSNVLNHLCNVI